MFGRVMIANRGEIAARVARACRTLGIESVVAHSEADRDAPWLDEADFAICIGPARSSDSYLNADAILQAAEQTESHAVHPGYGFLAENAIFAARCEQQGITFVGPPPSAIRRMGEKAEAKRSAAAAGLPTIPGSEGTLRDVREASRVAAQLGYPVLLKAAAGGGGKGMRRCSGPAELAGAFQQAMLEAEKAFGSPALYLERLIEEGRHVEFQVLCDAFGNAIHLGERECSIQRKHQKLIEEAPSPAMEAPTREELGGRVARAMLHLGYRSAGTVEFLRDARGDYHFMEMNTRLQVEHPVTELVTGVDLVVQQLRIAASEPLVLRQEDVALRGHAIEFRINAEDPDLGFRPDPGRIRRLDPPRLERDGVTVRWDSGVRGGYKIPPHYDSLLGKLIVHGPDRETTLDAAGEVLASFEVQGVSTTIPLHQRILARQEFRRGSYDIEFLERSGVLQR